MVAGWNWLRQGLDCDEKPSHYLRINVILVLELQGNPMRKKPSEIDFEEYIRQGDPEKKERAINWRTAIGLQAVDGLRVSDFLIEIARRNIEGEITMDEAQQLIEAHYQK